ncbi:hypothetical protein [Nitrosomonas sp. Is37]|uniref:hypothetical protein n=1 Tax=Nitrosomonas sp. Is37 TaxID=3080535 RepID=UPI00294AD700|nr:hypothetical protein [Nitrosomonas sp. Is37]MDV6345170.1 hypothetical protein [Nitrosomonas sp. Is37]
MAHRGIFKIFSFTRMVRSLRGASYVTPGANAALLFVAGGGPAASSRLVSHLDHHTLHLVQLRFLGLIQYSVLNE